MERLWTPWRMAYVAGHARDDCVFCIPSNDTNDADDLIVHRGDGAFIILNLYPYNSGHLMVVPYEHVATLEDIDPGTLHEMLDLATLSMEVARAVLRCDGFNMGMNVGKTAGAGVAEHIHMHVVPRWVGDANFMPILGHTMVLPELLPVTYARLRAELEATLAVTYDNATPQAGALVVLPEQRAVVLRRSATGDIVLPKGHIEAGETAADAAMREVREETGFDATPAGWAGSSTFDWMKADGTTEKRFVSYVLAVGSTTCDTDQHVNDDTLLVPIDDAAGMLSIPELAEMTRSLAPVLHRLCESAR